MMSEQMRKFAKVVLLTTFSDRNQSYFEKAHTNEMWRLPVSRQIAFDSYFKGYSFFL